MLRDAKNKVLAVKIGYSSTPEKREADYNKPLAGEVTGLVWKLHSKQPTAHEQTARDIEQQALAEYTENKLQSNGEILQNVDPNEVLIKIGVIMKSYPTD